MNPTRRTFLLAGALAGLAGGLGACGGPEPARGRTAGRASLDFWYWPGALSDGVVSDVAASLAARVTVTPTVVDGDFKQRLATTLSSKRSVPDITGVKGEDMPAFLAHGEDFLDLNPLGARSIADSFATAKYAQGTTSDGRQIGLPIDLGPTALFLRADLWAKAGLPNRPDAVGALTSSWDGWFEAAGRLKRRLPGTFAIRNSTDVFGVALAQQSETYVSSTGAFVGAGGGVKVAWDLAVRSITGGVQAGIYDDAAYAQALSKGTLTGQIGPAWNGLDIESAAPGTSGAWRVAAGPGGPANVGGSYLTLPSSCKDPELAFAFITQLLTPANQGRGFEDVSIFPSVTAAYALPALTRAQPFYGGQSTIEVFGPVAQRLPAVYNDPRNTAVSAPYFIELANVEGGKDATKAWADAVEAGRLVAQQPA